MRDSDLRPLPLRLPLTTALCAALVALAACGAPTSAEPPFDEADAGTGAPGETADGGETGPGDAGIPVTAEERARLQTVQGWLDEAVARAWTPGIAVAIVRADGEHVLTSGTLGWESPRAVDADTVFEVGSISKTFTSLLLAQAVGLGEVTLTQPAESLLPSGATLRKGPGGEVITLEHLSTHRSGLPREPPGAQLQDPGHPYGSAGPDALYAALKDVPLGSAPGAQFAYSNLGAGLLGHLTTRAAGVGSWEELVLRRVLLPLGMKRTFISPPADLNVAEGNSEGGPVPPIQFSMIEGAGAVRASANDMVRYVRAQLLAKAGRDELLPDGMGAALRLAMTPRVDTGVPGYGLGLGWFTGWPSAAQLPNAGAVAEHGGVTFGHRAMMVVSPDDALGVVILTNSTTLPDTALAASLIRLWRGEPRTFHLREAVQLPEDTLQRYVGRYALSQSFLIDITREGDRLYAQATGQPRFRIYPHSETSFHARAVEATFTFRLDGTGEVTGLTLQQNGGTHEAPRQP